MGINVPGLNMMAKNSASAGAYAGVALVSGPRTVRIALSLYFVTTIPQ